MTDFGNLRSAIQRRDLPALVELSFDVKRGLILKFDEQTQAYLEGYLSKHEQHGMVYTWSCALYQAMRRLQPCAPYGILMDYAMLWCTWALGDDLTSPCPYVLYHQAIPGFDAKPNITKMMRQVGWSASKINHEHGCWASNRAGVSSLWSIYHHSDDFIDSTEPDPMPLAVYLHGERIDLEAIDPLDYTYNHAWYGIVIPGKPQTSAAHRRKIEDAKRKHEAQQRQTQLLYPHTGDTP